jgi:cell division cycle 2-like protein
MAHYVDDDTGGASDRTPAGDESRERLSRSPADKSDERSSDESDRSSKQSSNASNHHGSLHDHLRSKFDTTAHDDSNPSDRSPHSLSGSSSSSDEDDESGDDRNHYQSESPVPSPAIVEPELPPYFPGYQGCRNVDEFQCLNRIEEGTYGVVYRAVDMKTNEIVAMKRLKMEKEKEGFPITSLREINTLLKSQHMNIVTVREIVVGSNMDKIYIVMDYVEHDLKSLMESMKESFSMGEVKTLMLQLLRGVAHLHDNWIIHRDLKTSNLLLSHKGILKIGDFGLAREYGSPLKHYTSIVVTLWYRAPELLLGTKEYSTPIDMWSVGCIFAEFLMKKPLFPGKSEIDELNCIFKELGTPTEKIWPGVSEMPAMKKCTFTEYPYNQLRGRFGTLLSDRGFDLLNKFLTYNPTRRISAEDALKHEFFSESPAPVDPSMFPTWPAKSERSRTRTHGNSPKPPSGGKAYAKLLADDADLGSGFHLVPSAAGIASAAAGFALRHY